MHLGLAWISGSGHGQWPGEPMIDLYFWPTPNGYKVSILLEELGLPYRVVPVDIWKGDQFKPAFLAIAPNNKMPAVVDTDGPDGKPLSIFESGAILLHYAEQSGRFIPRDVRGRVAVLEWLMFQMASVGPMLGQAHHFRGYSPEPIPYAIERYTKEATRIYRVIDKRLTGRAFVAGDYSIADMAIFPWIRSWEKQGQVLVEHVHLKRWFDTLAARPAVQRGLAVMSEIRRASSTLSAEERAVMFGAVQHAKR
jgi:GST-like protein